MLGRKNVTKWKQFCVTTLLMRQPALNQVKQNEKIWQKWNFNSKHPSWTYVLITWYKLIQLKKSPMLVIDTQTKALANMAARDFTKKFPHVILSRKWVKRRSFLFVISDVITLKAPSVCTPALTNKQHQNCHFDEILVF